MLDHEELLFVFALGAARAWDIMTDPLRRP
jgi:hypothetical protein